MGMDKLTDKQRQVMIHGREPTHEMMTYIKCMPPRD
jgi:hypothetical protein